MSIQCQGEEPTVRISQLAAATEVPLATIKFYLREHLLHEGQLTSATQASYDDSHVRRLKLIRALLGPGGLNIATTRELLQHIKSPPESPHELLGIAHQAVLPPAADGADLTQVRDLMDRWGWRIHPDDRRTPAALAQALQGLADAGFELPEDALDDYARAMSEIATMEIEGVPVDSAEAAVRYVVLGTVLVEPLLLALRRLAQQDASTRRFDDATSEELRPLKSKPPDV